MSNIIQIANNTIASAEFKSVLTKQRGDTKDIIDEIMYVEQMPQSKTDLKNFAHHLKANNVPDTLYNIWSFVKHKIHYIIDTSGKQFIKTPSRIWADGYADCKGYSIFTSSVLKNLGITSFGYRFVSYSSSPIYTHVYVYVLHDGKEYILDSVMDEFNKEKPYKFKKDISMTQIYRMSGFDDSDIGNKNRRGTRSGSTGRRGKVVKKVTNLGRRTPDQMTEGELDLWIARDRLKTEQAIVKSKGRGLKAEQYQDSIDMLEDAIEVVQKGTSPGVSGADADDMLDELMDIAADAVNGIYSIAHQVHGIGSIGAKKAKRKEKKAARKAKRQERKQGRKEARKQGGRKAVKAWRKEHGTKTGKFLQKAGQKAKQGLKAVAKVVTAPQRLFIKGLLEVSLPKASPFFLYLFINDPALVAKLPPKAKQKRDKSEKVANFIVDVIGMKRPHFMGIVRNGIMKQYKKSPETVIAEQMKGKMSGIGAADWIAAALNALTAIINGIAKFFGNKMDMDISEDDFPMPFDEDETSFDVYSSVESNSNAGNWEDDSGGSYGNDYGSDYGGGSYDDGGYGGGSYDGGNSSAYESGGGKSIWNSLGF